MKSIIVSAFILILFPVVAAAQSLEGVWTTDEYVVSGGENAGSYTDLQPSLVIYTKSHYSAVMVLGSEPRALLDDDSSDEERLAAFARFAANAGTYKLDGSTLIYTPSVAKIPNFMSGDSSQSWKIEWDGKNAFWAIHVAGLPIPDEVTDFRSHWVRVED